MPERSPTTATQEAVEPPTRGADHNQSLADQANPPSSDHLLPSLDDGITLLDVEGGRGVRVLQSLVLDHLLLHEGPAFWVDANGHATTTTLAQLAPSRRLLDRIHVARGFTAYLHYGAVRDLPTAVEQSIQQSAGTTRTRDRRSPPNDGPSPATPSLVVVPAVDAPYRGCDSLSDTHAETLQARTLARLATYTDGFDVPVLLTRSTRDAFTASVETAADHRLTCKRTRLGPRFVGDDFETLVYPVHDGAYYQTTFAYWQQVLAARATQVGLDPTPAAPSTERAAAVGTSVTTDGESTTLGANPLLDALTAAGTGGR